MSNKRITDLTELTTPTTDDVFPVVDIATNTTTKVQLANLPVQTAVTTALATKQATLVSGTNIKTVNSNSLLGAGDVAVQETLVSGTNIKTLNSVSLLGSGNIVLAATPSGVAGAIQFSNGSAFASDAANLFWDDTNNRLGIGTNTPTTSLDVNGSIRAGVNLTVVGEIQNPTVGVVNINGELRVASPNVSIGLTSYPARLTVKGSGSTSATTSLLVQNSAGTTSLQITDSNLLCLGGTTSSFPAIKRNGIVLEARLADDSLYCNFSAAVGSFTGFNSSAFTNNYALGSNANVKQKLVIEDGTPTAITTSALVEMKSTTLGFLPPRMTTTQKNAIASPASGLILYDSTTNKLQCYNGSTWNDLF